MNNMSRQSVGSFKGFPKPATTSQSSDFFGPGLSFEAVPAAATSEVEQLKRENEQLRQQLQHQQELLSIWQQQPCTLCQLHSTHTSTRSSSTGSASRGRAKPSRNLAQQDGTACRNDSSSSNAASCCQAVQCRLDRALRQQQVQLAQMQKQVLVLQAELSSREQLVLEADAVLAEAARRLTGLAATAAAAAPTLGSGSGSSVKTPQRQTSTAAGSSSSSRRLASGAGVRSGAAGAGHVAPAAGVVAVADQLVEQAQGVASWCNTAVSRISRGRAASAAQCAAARDASNCWGGSSSSSGARGMPGSRGSWDDGAEAEAGVMSSLQQLQLQYVPAGGNKYLAKHTSLPSLAQGQGLSLLHLPALQSLMQLLASLALPLAELAVQLRSIVLPVLPWLGSTTGSVGHVLPETYADLAHAAAAAAGELVELCSVLPAVPGCLSAAATAAAGTAAAARAAAAQHASQWGSSSSSRLADTESAEVVSYGSGTRCSKQQQQQQQQQPDLELDPADEQLLHDLAALLLPPASRQQGSKSKDHRSSSSSSRRSGGGGTGAMYGTDASPQRNRSSAEVNQQQQQQGAMLMQQLTQRWRVLWFKRCVLEHQLGFVARCSAEQTKLVSGLVQRAAAAAADAAEEFEAEGELQQRREDAVQLARQLLRGLLLLDQHSFVHQQGGAGSGSALRALAGLLRQQRDVVEDLPQLLQESSAAAVKAAVLAAVAGAFEDFRCELQLAQQSCNTAVSRATAAAQR
uniref:Uncharacterized protein n=1 Tax=Tetradesmus obliquus TaxID=3088 RepID=A0A383V972_TETOB